MSRVPLKDREYWRPGECAQVLGRETAFWTRAFDQGFVRGYRENGRNRYINAASARGYLESLMDAHSVSVPPKSEIDLKQLARDGRAAIRKLYNLA